MKLIIAEKSSVGQSIAAVVGASSRHDGYMEGSGWIVSWCIGHLVDLAPPDAYDSLYSKWNINVPIVPKEWLYQVLPGTKKQYGIVSALMLDERVDSIMFATDCGREGELIARLVYQHCGCTKPVKRLWISSMEEAAIREGLDNLKDASLFDRLNDDAQSLAMASGKTLGSSSIAYGNYQSNSFSSFPGGWSTEITGGDDDNRASVGSQFYLAQYDNNKRSMIYSRWSYNFNGVYNIRFSMYVGGDGSKFTTYFETDSDQSYSGSTKSYSQSGKRSWKEDDLRG